MSESSTTFGATQIDKVSDLGAGDQALFSYWLGEDRIAGKEEAKWVESGRRVVKRYRDERPQNSGDRHKFNILWSNVQTLQPILYGRVPKPDVQRRFLDQDDVGRLAGILLERSISYTLENGSFDEAMKGIVQDRLLPGRGVARVVYVPHYGDPLTDNFEDDSAAATDVTNPGDDPDPLREVVYEEVVVNYIYWEDYREGPARTWREVPWVRYRSYLTREQLVTRFGATKGNPVNLDFTPKGMEQQDPDKSRVPPDIFKKAIVHEYWDREKKRVIWLAPGTPDLILDQIDDPLGLPDFFPNPDPLLATTTTDRRIPVPDYVEYQDQAHELDLLTGRIDILTRALKVSGIYPADLKASLQQLISGTSENKLIPVENWAAFMEKGGLQGAIAWTPIKEVASTLIQLSALRDKVKEMIYEVTGIGDIMRGQTNPDETATAQQLKSAFSTRRVEPQQRAVARIARDLIRIVGAIIAEHFSNQTISMITGYPQLLPVPEVGPPPPQFLAAPMPQPQPVQPPANDSAPAEAGLPPQAAAQLKEGVVTRFPNGQRWTLQGGQPRAVA